LGKEKEQSRRNRQKVEETDQKAQKTVENIIKQRDDEIKGSIAKESDASHTNTATFEESASGIKPII